MSAIKVVYTEINEGAHAGLLEKYLPDFPDHLREKILNYRTWQDTQLSLLGIVMALDAVNNVSGKSYTAGDLEYTASNKPFIRGSGVHFSISHSGTLAVCAVCATHEVGIDIECRSRQELDFLYPNMTAAEIQIVNDAADKTAALYCYWTQKEAVLKASGVGLIDELREFEIIDGHTIFRGAHYSVEEVFISRDYTCMAAIGCREHMRDALMVQVEQYKSIHY